MSKDIGFVVEEHDEHWASVLIQTKVWFMTGTIFQRIYKQFENSSGGSGLAGTSAGNVSN